MKNLLANLKLNPGNFIKTSDLAKFKGGMMAACDLKTCINCCNTAVDITCNYSNDYSKCVQTICNSCFANFSSYPSGCYCNSGAS